MLAATVAFVTIGSTELVDPLEGMWQRETSKSVFGRDVSATRVLDLSTDESGNVSGELVVTVKLSEAFDQKDEVRRFRVDGQYDPPNVVLKFYKEGGEMTGERNGRMSEDGKTLQFGGEGDDDVSTYTKLAKPTTPE